MIEKHENLISLPNKAKQAARKLVRWWVQGKDLRISAGAGRGLRFNSAHSNPAYTIGTNEMPVQHALVEHLRPGDTFYDIGANVGFFTMLAAHLVGDAGEVIAFEPVPKNAAAIRHNQHLNGFRNITILEQAVANTCGTAQLQVTHVSGGATLTEAGQVQDIEYLLQVPVTTVDACLRDHKYSAPNVIKIDVEGAELSVLLGMSYTIHCYRPVVIFEVDDQDLPAFEQKSQSCQSFLRGFGYTITRLKDAYPESGWLVANFLALP
jgi:FkbM family methyltransferase